MPARYIINTNTVNVEGVTENTITNNSDTEGVNDPTINDTKNNIGDILTVTQQYHTNE